jgi:hypothetical protein
VSSEYFYLDRMSASRFDASERDRLLVKYSNTLMTRQPSAFRKSKKVSAGVVFAIPEIVAILASLSERWIRTFKPLRRAWMVAMTPVDVKMEPGRCSSMNLETVIGL